MRRVLIVAATCAAASASLAQSGPSGGYYPWTLSYPSIGYDFGGITLPTDVAGGSKGKGTINAQGVYANGELMLGGSFGANMAPARPLIRGGVFSRTPTLHEFLTGTDENGAFLAARPSCADLSDSAGSCSADATNASNITSGTLDPARLPQYATNAAVKAISLTGKSAGYAIFRQGFSSAGDGGQMTYYLSTSACSISGGNDATQIAPNSGTGCWIAENRTAYDARIFGIVEGDSGAGSATNSAALTKMFALAAGPEIVFPAGVYRIACTTAQQIPSSTIYYHYLAASGVYLRGQGRERTKLKFDAGCLFNGNVFLWRSLATAPTPRGGVADLTIDLGAPQTPAVRAAILAANANNHDIDSFVVERAGVIHGTTRMHLVSGVAAGGKTLKGFRVSKSYLQLTSLPREATITGASWSGGSATFNVSADLRDALSANLYVFVRNATPSAWNGTWRVTAITASQITVAMTSDPGAYSSGGLAQAYVDNYCIATSLPGVTGYIPDSVVEDTECDGSGVQLDGERPKFVRNNVHHYNFGGAIYLPFSVSALAGVSNASWAGGVGTLTVGSDITSVLEVGKLAAINGVTPSAWNGFWKVASKSANTITVEMPTNPGAYASGGYVMRGEPSTRACVVSDNVFHDTEYTADVNNTEPGGAENHCVDSIFSNNIIYNIGSSGIVNFSDKATYVGNVFRNVGAGVPAWTQRT
ncbi:MAG: hypothetical protein N2444_00355, partial [Methylocystis sp.]|nr:hypothetical protein [Methylocystis sp.]